MTVSIVAPRLDPKPWGGQRLAGLGVELPPGAAIGEALLTAGDAKVTTGAFAGETLDGIVRSHSDLLGSRGQDVTGDLGCFPLLAKLIDANEHLSIQVHPNDEDARTLGKLGKTEAWHVLAARPGSHLYLGVRPGVSMEDFSHAAARLDGSTAPLMRTIPARAGQTVLIPAGTIHALGSGVVVYEIQQPSDVTYRLDDWGRVDAAGNPRDVHLEEGFAVARPEFLPEPISPLPIRTAIGERHILATCRYFALERIALPGGGPVSVGSDHSPAVVTVVRGIASIASHRIGAGESAVVWPGFDPVTMTASQPLVALLAYVPDLD